MASSNCPEGIESVGIFYMILENLIALILALGLRLPASSFLFLCYAYAHLRLVWQYPMHMELHPSQFTACLLLYNWTEVL